MFYVIVIITTNIIREYTQKEMRIKACHCKQSAKHKRGNKRVKKGKKCCKTYRRQQNNNSMSFPVSNYSKPTWIKSTG